MVEAAAPHIKASTAAHDIVVPAGIFWRQTQNQQIMSLRRGYTKPLATIFADSAKNRESVMALGSIAHVQHYFARTGLLDGKGAGYAASPSTTCSLDDSSYGSMTSSPVLASSVSSVLSEDQEIDEDVLLPPTVSTYAMPEKIVPPPPTLDEMRRDLCDTLDAASKALAEAAPPPTTTTASPAATSAASPTSSPLAAGISPSLWPSSDQSVDPASISASTSDEFGWQEVQGLHLLDTLTLAIKSARGYYTSHPHPARLSFLKSDRKIREDLFGTLEVLKRMASRNFAGGIRRAEHVALSRWVVDVLAMLEQEIALEAEETRRRQSWAWLDDDWAGREHEREWLFLSSFTEAADRFDPSADTTGPLPTWPETSPSLSASLSSPSPPDASNAFVDSLRSGIRLVRVHNALVAHSRKRFGAIERWHNDVEKPYRAADNLRFWLKAAEIRWEIRLPAVDALAVVRGQGDALRTFEVAVGIWCRGVREEITVEARAGGEAGVKA